MIFRRIAPKKKTGRAISHNGFARLVVFFSLSQFTVWPVSFFHPSRMAFWCVTP